MYDTNFQQDISNWNVGAVKRHGGMFAYGVGFGGLYEEGPRALAAAFRPTFSTAAESSDDESRGPASDAKPSRPARIRIFPLRMSVQ